MISSRPVRASPGLDWRAWHDDYADPNSPLSRRLVIVREHITTWLDSRPNDHLTLTSGCSGQGHDLLGVLAGRTDTARVTLLDARAGPVVQKRQRVWLKSPLLKAKTTLGSIR